MTKSKAVAKTTGTAVGEPVKFASMGASERIDKDDIRIPKLHLMQQMSDLVQSEVAKKGEYRNSVTNELLGAKNEKPVELIIFKKNKVWHEISTETKKYLRTVAFYGNEDLPFEGPDVDGVIVHRDKVLQYFCLLANEVKENPETAFPYCVDFKRTSRNAGAFLESTFLKMRGGGLPSYAKTFTLTAVERSNDHGTYWVKEVGVGRDVTQAEANLTETWINHLATKEEQGNVKVDETELNEQARTSPKSAAPTNF